MKISTLAIAVSVFRESRKAGFGLILCVMEFIHILRSKFEIVVTENDDGTIEIE